MTKIIDWLNAHKTACIYAISVIVVAVLAFALWYYTHPPQTVTTESQVQTETPAGVTLAADNAHIGLAPDQAQQAADKIKYIYTHDAQPIYTVTTTGANVEKQAQAAQQSAGADFSIVTNKSNPNESPDLSKIPAGSTVELNQYNVQAYKKVLHTVEISPDIDATGVSGINEIGYTVSRKITSDGKYIGLGASYNIDDHKTMVKLSYTW